MKWVFSLTLVPGSLFSVTVTGRATTRATVKFASGPVFPHLWHTDLDIVLVRDYLSHAYGPSLIPVRHQSDFR